SSLVHLSCLFLILPPPPPSSTLFPYTTLFRSRTQIDKLDHQLLKLANERASLAGEIGELKNDQGAEVFSPAREEEVLKNVIEAKDRKSTRLNSSHVKISYAVFCLKKKKNVTRI